MCSTRWIIRDRCICFTENRKTGAVTDVDGHFTITVPNTKVSLTFSYVGYTTQKIALKDRKLLKVVLKEEFRNCWMKVVVVGYGTQKKNQCNRFYCSSG